MSNDTLDREIIETTAHRINSSGLERRRNRLYRASEEQEESVRDKCEEEHLGLWLRCCEVSKVWINGRGGLPRRAFIGPSNRVP